MKEYHCFLWVSVLLFHLSSNQWKNSIVFYVYLFYCFICQVTNERISLFSMVYLFYCFICQVTNERIIGYLFYCFNQWLFSMVSVLLFHLSSNQWKNSIVFYGYLFYCFICQVTNERIIVFYVYLFYCFICQVTNERISLFSVCICSIVSFVK